MEPVRDYVHVLDLADAHERALQRLSPGDCVEVNLGSGQGTSVLEIVEQAREITGQPIPADLAERRPGDPPRLIANNHRARMELAWEPTHSDLETILSLSLGLASKPPAWLCTISVRFIMQALIIEKPYQFVRPPRRSFVLWVVAGLRLYRIWLKSSENIYEYEVKNQHRIQTALGCRSQCARRWKSL